MKLSELNLKEHSVYKVSVSLRGGNPHHEAILFTGFSNGNYTCVFNNSYDDAEHNLDRADFLNVTELCQLRD